MGGLKRCASDDEEQVRKKARLLKRGLAAAVKQGFEAGVAYCKGQEGDMQAWTLYELSKVVEQKNMDSFINMVGEMLKEDNISAGQAAGLAETIKVLKSRTADPLVQGQIACMQLRLPASSGLTATTPPPPQTAEDLANYTSEIRNIASSAQGLSNYPHFTAALSKVHDIKPSVKTEAGYGSLLHESDSSTLWNPKKSTETLLKALVTGQSVIGSVLDSSTPTQIAQDKSIQNAETLLKAAVAGITKSLGPDGAEHAVCEGMREYVWKARKAGGYKPLDVPNGTSRTNEMTLPKAPKHVLSKFTAPTGIEGFLKGDSADIPDGNTPTCSEFLSTAAMHLHPDAGMDKEYMVSNNPLYVWRAARLLLLTPECKIEPLLWSTDPESIEAYINNYYPKLGEETIKKMMS